MNATQYLKTSFGILRIECSETAVLSISAETETAAEHPNELSRKTVSELSEYFAGVRLQFDLPICPEGTEFQKRVWEELRKIPYGETRSYGEIAEAVGPKRFSRAVGGANHRNPILILIPCHRVVASDGSLGGFAAGARLKARLLKLEAGE